MMANDTDNYLTANFVSCCVRGLRKHYEESACNDYHFHVIQSDYVHHLGVSAGARPGDYRGCGRRGSNNRSVLCDLTQNQRHGRAGQEEGGEA